MNDGSPRPEGIDSTRALVGAFEGRLRVRYLYLEPQSTQYRLAQAHNFAIRHSHGDYIAFVNGDSIPSPDLAKLISEQVRPNRILIGIRKHIPMGIAPSITPDDVSRLDALVEGRDLRLARPDWFPEFLFLKDIAPPGSWRLCWGCMFVVPVEPLLAVGGYDESFREWGAEDEDLAERLVRARGCVFWVSTDLFVYHLDHPTQPYTGPNPRLAQIRTNWTAVRNGGPLQRSNAPERV